MLVFAAVALLVIAITSTLLLLLPGFRKLAGSSALIASGLVSLVLCFGLPWLFSMVYSYVSLRKGTGFEDLAISLAATLVIYLLVVLASGTAVTRFAAGRLNAAAAGDAGEISGFNYLEEIYDNIITEIPANNEENASEVEINADNEEKAVDSVENTDKMRIEQKTVEISELGGSDLEGCIDEAFRLKVQGDLEGAILSYMCALDKKPEGDLVFWIVLDICVLYKELGQTELARDILSGYVDCYGDVMSAAAREEIERNL